MCASTWKLDFKCPLIRIDNISPPQSPKVALRIVESVPEEKSKFSKHFPFPEQISQKSFEIMRENHILLINI